MNELPVLSKKSIVFQDYMRRIYPDLIKDGQLMAKTITFQVTDACNLACTYCYQINKGVRKMSFETAKKMIDMLLTDDPRLNGYVDYSPAIVLEFIGGEPLLEIHLIEQIIDYFLVRAIELDHPWRYKFGVNITSNGTLYFDKEVQRVLTKYSGIISYNVTVDGTKKLHDSCRLFPDGSPSYDLAHSAAMHWRSLGHDLSSKITLAPENIEYLFDCLKQMVLDDYKIVHANVVYEDVWNDIKYAKTLYEKCKLFADWFIDNNYDLSEYNFNLLLPYAFKPKAVIEDSNWCGGDGDMLAVDPDGYLYPCIRYMESSLGNDQPPLVIGHVDTGIAITPCEKKCVSCLYVTRRSQSTDECFYCPVAGNCGWCSGYNYQRFGTLNKRSTAICDLTKARALASCYFYNKYFVKNGIDTSCDLWLCYDAVKHIISKEEYDMLCSLVRDAKGFINEDKLQFSFNDVQDIENFLEEYKERNYEKSN